ncbi:MAG TPA: transglutaminaseTgpA domain-containing protein [Catenuloplanes sp.]
MTGQRRLGFVAAAATLLAAAPLSAIYDQWTWLLRCLITVALIAAAAAVSRSLRAPVWAQVLAMCGALLLVLTWMFPSDEEFLALLPSPDTFAWFGSLVTQAGDDMRGFGVPVPDRQALLFITVLGVGGVAIVVDVLAVGLRRPALAGLPMLAIYSVPVAVYVDSVPPIPFVVGAVGFLWLLVADNVERVRRFGRRFTGDGRDVDVWEPSPLAAAGRRLTVVGVAAAVLLPLAVPGMTSGLLAQVTQSGAGDGLGVGRGNGQVKLFADLSGRLNQTRTTELIRVSTSEPEPYYLRFGVADVLDEQGFSNRPPARGQAITRPLPDPREDPKRGVTHRKYEARVQVTGEFNMPMAPTYAAPIGVRNLDSSWFYDPLAQVVHSSRSRSKDKTYEFDYVVSSYSTAALRAADPLPADDPLRSQFTDVPTVREVNDRVAALTEDEDTDYDKVRAIYDSFSRANGFSYSLNATAGGSDSEIVSFLTSKVGFCQQYAAAMAWMVRAAGIPARVAFGFTRGVKQPDNTYVLTNRNVHAWTEVYFNGLGWVPFDATPAASVVGSARPEWAPDSDRVEPAGPSAAPTAAPTGNSSAGPDSPDNRANEDDLGAPGAAGRGDSPAGGIGRWLAVAGGVLALLVLLMLPALRRVRLRRRRRHSGAVAPPTPRSEAGGPAGTPAVVLRGATAERAREDAHAAWDELIDTMIDFRLPVDPAETPRLTAQRLATGSALAGPAAQGAMLLGRAEERARYARDPMQAERLGDALADVRGALASRAGRRVRFVAMVLPPSVLRRWRDGVSLTTARTAGAISRRTAAMSRFNPLSRWNPRRLLAGRSTR